MKLKQSWKDELLALVNNKNSLQLTLDDVKFELTEPVSEVPGTVVVTIKPNDDSRYFNEQSLTYIRRDIAKNFTGIPLRVIVKQDTAVKDIINTIAERYGLVFDTTVDFLESELNKQITFADTGIKDITVPVANTSYVWAGNLQFHVANDTLDLVTIIQKTALTNLAYLDGVEDTTGSLLLATSSIVDDAGNTAEKEGVLDSSYFEKVLKVLVRYGDITDEQMQQALTEITGSETAREVEAVEYGDAQLLVTKKKDWSIGNLKGAFVVTRYNDAKTYRYVLHSSGQEVTLDLNGWTDITVDWGDGVTDTNVDRMAHHYYSDSKDHVVIATGTLKNPSNPTEHQQLSGDGITQIDEWDNGLPMGVQLINLDKLVKVPDTIPIYWTTLESLFESCKLINDENITKWNTSNITSMKNLFFGCAAFNQPIGSWDISSVKNIDNMLSGCAVFNQDLSGWTFSEGTSHDNYDNSATVWQSDYKPKFAD